jgi:hypothetical protein
MRHPDYDHGTPRARRRRRLLERIAIRLGRRREVHGILVSAFTDKANQEIALERVVAAVELIRRYDPAAFRRMQSGLKRILVSWLPGTWGEYQQELDLCVLSEERVCARETSVAAIASTMVHEATHARLARAGVPYDETMRPRIERVCFRAQRAFGRRLPDGRDVVDLAERQLVRKDDFTSNDAQWHRLLDSGRKIGFPGWVLDWVNRRRESRRKRPAQETKRG